MKAQNRYRHRQNARCVHSAAEHPLTQLGSPHSLEMRTLGKMTVASKAVRLLNRQQNISKLKDPKGDERQDGDMEELDQKLKDRRGSNRYLRG
jgi:hypothetical protein